MNNSNDGQKIVQCPVCQARWVDGQLFWATGKMGRNIDLAGLCCNPLAARDEERCKGCINPCRGKEGGDTWADRLSGMERLDFEQGDRQ